MIGTLAMLGSTSVAGGGGGGGGGGAAPVVSNVTVDHLDVGSCASSRDAQLVVDWDLTNPDAVNYSIKIYENSILMDTLAGSATSTSKSIAGQVEYPANSPLDFIAPANWTYRIDVVRLSDGQVVSSASSAEWTQSYGFCP